MKDSETLLMDAGVPQTLWDNKDSAIEFLCRKVIALSEQVGSDTEIIDDDNLKEVEDKVYTGIMQLNNIEVFKQYSKSYLLTLSESDRVATKSALVKFSNERNVQPSEYWI